MYMSQIIELDRKYIPKKAIGIIDFIQFVKNDLHSKKNAFVRVQFLSLSIKKIIILWI